MGMVKIDLKQHLLVHTDIFERSIATNRSMTIPLWNGNANSAMLINVHQTNEGFPNTFSKPYERNMVIFGDYIEKNCIQSIQCCISRRSKTAKIKCYKINYKPEYMS